MARKLKTDQGWQKKGEQRETADLTRLLIVDGGGQHGGPARWSGQVLGPLPGPARTWTSSRANEPIGYRFGSSSTTKLRISLGAAAGDGPIRSGKPMGSNGTQLKKRRARDGFICILSGVTAAAASFVELAGRRIWVTMRGDDDGAPNRGPFYFISFLLPSRRWREISKPQAVGSGPNLEFHLVVARIKNK